MNERVELRIPPDSQLVGLARYVVMVAARKAGMGDERSEDLRIAVSETTTNAIFAHERAQTSAPITLTFGPEEADAFVVAVEDAGPGFDPGEMVDLEQRDWSLENGLGVTLVRELADDVAFERTDEGMRVTLRFALGAVSY